jgi:hypothetical protein
MNASLVFDGFGQPRIPESMGQPSPDQLTGTPLENLGELASRICYDSLGNGRSSGKLHEHILEVKNHSVYEHANFTVSFPGISSSLEHNILLAVVSRKGVWFEKTPSGVEVTANLRAVLEWERHSAAWLQGREPSRLGSTLRSFASRLAPLVVSPGGYAYPDSRLVDGDLTDDQAWVTLWLYGSRGFTHEQVRHRFAMSQRSTRYVDEDGSPYIQHPLVTKYLDDINVPAVQRKALGLLVRNSTHADRETYREAVVCLQEYGVTNGLDKLTARKQARGAARGYLGNALASEMLFSAPVSGWKWILRQRANKLADAEIRAVYEDALAALKSSRYGDRFSEFNLIPSPDGLGKVLA